LRQLLVQSLAIADYFSHSLAYVMSHEMVVCGLCAKRRPSASLLYCGEITEMNCHRLLGLENPLPFGPAYEVAGVDVETWNLSDFTVRCLHEAEACASEYGHPQVGTEHLLETVFRSCSGKLDRWAQLIGFGSKALVIERLLGARSLTKCMLEHPGYPYFVQGEQVDDGTNVVDEAGNLLIPRSSIEQATYLRIMSNQ